MASIKGDAQDSEWEGMGKSIKKKIATIDRALNKKLDALKRY